MAARSRDRVHRALHEAQDDIGNGAECRTHGSGAISQCVEASIGGVSGGLGHLLGDFGYGVDHGLSRVADPTDGRSNCFGHVIPPRHVRGLRHLMGQGLMRYSKLASLFDHLVGAPKQW